MNRRALGTSGIDVSILSLGSWQTYERIPRERALAVMHAAREAGITFLDDARYDDTTGRAPMRTGWSEVLFGELVRAVGWQRDAVVIANKLWWEFWPEQSPMQELDESLQRTGLDYFDLEYSAPLPKGLSAEQAVHEIAPLLASGKLRAWGVLNWSPVQVAEATRVAHAAGIAAPCAAQLQYSLVSRSVVNDDEMQAALAKAGANVVASAALAYGTLSGKYARSDSGRLSGQLDDSRHAAALAAVPALEELAARLGTRPATLAYAFALDHRSVASVLFGATTPEQVDENVAAATILEQLSTDDRTALAAIGANGGLQTRLSRVQGWVRRRCRCLLGHQVARGSRPV